MNIYTKTGDKGDTSLVGGTRVSKRDPRVDAYGTIDELIANIAVIRSLCNHSETDTNLRRVQATLMLCAAHIASDGTSDKVKTLDTGEIKFLEEQIDYMQSNMPLQTAFILPSSPPQAAHCHVSRTVCRRAERVSIAMREYSFGESYDNNQRLKENIENSLKYLNRLSDYLFVLGRYLAHKSGIGDDFWYQ